MAWGFRNQEEADAAHLKDTLANSFLNLQPLINTNIPILDSYIQKMHEGLRRLIEGYNIPSDKNPLYINGVNYWYQPPIANESIRCQLLRVQDEMNPFTTHDEKFIAAYKKCLPIVKGIREEVKNIPAGYEYEISDS